jgi:hypothetical protein
MDKVFILSSDGTKLDEAYPNPSHLRVTGNSARNVLD